MAYWPDTGSGVDTQPARKPVQSAIRKYFSEGGVGQPPTVPGGDWFNQMTNEVLNVLAAAGIEPSKTDDDQLLLSFFKLSGRSFDTIADAISNGSLEVGQRVYWLGRYELSDGGGNWGVVKEGPHVEDGGSIFSVSPTLYIEANLKGRRVNVRKFGARAVVDGPVYDCITQIRSCESFIRSLPDPALQPTMYFPSGKYGISDTWHVSDVLEFEIYCDNTHFVSMASEEKGAMILCSDWVLSSIKGKVRFDNTKDPTKANFDCGLSIQAATKGTNKNDFYNITSMYFRAGLVVGDKAVDKQCSENMFYNYNTFECPCAVDGGGSESGATFIGGNIHGAPHANLPTSPIHTLWAKGGFWSFNGSGILTTQSASNQCIRMNPDSGAKPAYPQVRINGGVLETASPLVLIDNPDGIVLNPDEPKGQFSIVGIGGYCGDTPIINANFIEAAEDYEGIVQVKDNNFYCAAQRNAFNISVGSKAVVDTDKSSWGSGFRDWIGGCNGGRLVHSDTLVAGAYGAASATYQPSVKQTIKMGNKYNLDRYSRYGAFYDLSSGVFTCPPGGIQALKIEACILSPSINGDFFVEVDGVAVAFGVVTSTTANLSATIENLEPGQTVGVYLQANSSPVTLTNVKATYLAFTAAN